MEDLVGDAYKFDINYQRFANFLGIDKYTREDIDVAKKLSFLYDWAKGKVGREDSNLIFNEVNNLQEKLGVHSIGQDLLTRLYRAVRLDFKDTATRDREALAQVRETEARREQIRKEATRKIKEYEGQKVQLAEESLRVDKGNLRYVKSYIRSFKEEPKLRVKNIKSEVSEVEVLK